MPYACSKAEEVELQVQNLRFFKAALDELRLAGVDVCIPFQLSDITQNVNDVTNRMMLLRHTRPLQCLSSLHSKGSRSFFGVIKTAAMALE